MNPQPDISSLYNRAWGAGQIIDIISLSNFLNLSDKDLIEGSNKNICSQLLHTYKWWKQEYYKEASVWYWGKNSIYSGAISTTGFREFCTILYYKKDCKNISIKNIRDLKRLKRELASKKLNSRT